MATYADGDVLMMERTAALAVAATLTAITIPTITGANGAVIRPLYMEIAEASADFSMRVNEGATAGTTAAIVAADLALANRPLVPITPNTAILMLDGAGTTTVDVRWIYPAMTKEGRVATVPHASLMPVVTFSIAVTDTAATVTIPTDAVEMVINTSAGGGATPGVRYAVAASGTPTAIINVLATGISHGAPYRIFVADDDVIRIVRNGDTNQTIVGFWRLAV